MEQKEHTAEDEFNDIIDRIELRAMACDGPVTPTLKEATEEELSRLWELVNEISPKRKAISRRILQGKETDQDTNDYLMANGLDPEVVGKTGALFVKAVCENIKLKKENSEALESYNRECKRNDELQEEVDTYREALASLVKGLAMETKYHPEIKRSIVVNVRITNAQRALSKHQPIKKDETV